MTPQEIDTLLNKIKSNIALYIDDPDEQNDLSPLTECLDLIETTLEGEEDKARHQAIFDLIEDGTIECHEKGQNHAA